MRKMRGILLAAASVLLVGLAACADDSGGEYEYDADSAADCAPGEEYDDEFGVCYGYDEAAGDQYVPEQDNGDQYASEEDTGDQYVGEEDAGGEYEYEADSAADCAPGEEYDDAYGVCWGYEDAAAADEGNADGYVDADYPDEGYYETAEDCYDDEVYDPVDQLCYLADDADADYGSLFDDVFGAFSGDGETYQDLDEFGDNAIITYDVRGNEIVNPQKMSVSSDLEVYQNDADTHRSIWTYFANLVPQDQRTFVSKYSIFTDGQDNVMAAVAQDESDPEKWVLAVDIVDAANQQELTYSLIHEFGHLLTLNNEQVNINEDLFYQQDNEDLYNDAAASCPAYFVAEGCTRSSSYINSFYERFWTEFAEELSERESIQDEGDYQDAAYAFYQRYSDQFVTEYAATNPGEDIAESWTAFILQPKPTGSSIADQKTLFFYDYPELVRLRGQITSRAFSRLRVRP